MDLNLRLKGFQRRSEGHPPTDLTGDLLTIDCRGCGYAPVPGSKECLGCMVERMCETGGADRLVLRTGKDIEISGKAGRAVKEAASLRRWSLPHDVPTGRCRTCPVSRREIMSRAWERFPEGMTDGLAEQVVSQVPDRDGCRGCIEATVRALVQLDEGMAGILAGMTGRQAP